MTFFDFLKSRHLVEACTCDEAKMASLLEKPQTLYIGFDPTASCLQAGNYVAIQTLAQFQRAGHHVIALVGGATGMIGDPSGRSTERNFLSVEQLQKNLEGIKENLSRFLDFNRPGNPARLVNNYDWYKDYAILPFLREVGTLFRMKPMLAKDSVQKRLNAETNSMTFTEFCYQILQGYDFYYLYKHYGCTLQVGGADQWGNITAGTDLIRRLEPEAEVNGLTIPLVCDANGQKFGKSAGNAIFLNADKTSVYAFYQFFLRTLDADAIRYLRIFTFLDDAHIADLARSLREHPEQREPQRVLAEELTRTVHGEQGLLLAQRASNVLFGGSLEGLSASELDGIASDIPSAQLPASAVFGQPVVDVAVACGFLKSKGEARRLIQGGGLSVNNEKVLDPALILTPDRAVEGKAFLLRQGKKSYFLLRITA